MINRWVILVVSVFLPVWVFGLCVSAGSRLAMVVVSILSFLGFLISFALGYVIAGFQAGNNDWVQDVKYMDWLFNPMYSAWLFANHRRKFLKNCTISSALGGFVFGVLFSFLVSDWWTTVAASDLASGYFGSLGLMAIVGLFCYEVICKPLTQPEVVESSKKEPYEKDKEEALHAREESERGKALSYD